MFKNFTFSEKFKALYRKILLFFQLLFKYIEKVYNISEIGFFILLIDLGKEKWHMGQIKCKIDFL